MKRIWIIRLYRNFCAMVVRAQREQSRHWEDWAW